MTESPTIFLFFFLVWVSEVLSPLFSFVPSLLEMKRFDSYG